MKKIKTYLFLLKEISMIGKSEFLVTDCILKHLLSEISNELFNISQDILSDEYTNEKIVDEIMTLCNLLDMGE